MPNVAAMGELFLSRIHYLGAKIETVPGTIETLSASDYNLLAENIKFTIDWKENQRKYTVGDPNPFPSVMGARSATITLSMNVQGSGIPGTSPVWYTLAKAAGCREVNTAFGAMLIKELTGTTLTIGYILKEDTSINPRGKLYLAKGCAAEKFAIQYNSAGSLMGIEATFKGAFWDVSDLTTAQLPAPFLTNDKPLPASVLSCYSKHRNTVMPTASMVLDFGNKLELVEYTLDPTGYSHAVITDHDPVVNTTPFIQLESTVGHYAELAGTAGVTGGKFEAILGATGTQGNFFTFYMPNSKVVKGLDVDTRTGLDSTNVMIRAYREFANSGMGGYTGMEILKITQGSATGMYGTANVQY